MKIIILVLIGLLHFAFAGSTNHSFQDAEYNKVICAKYGGEIEQSFSGGRADCLSNDFVLETEFADLWNKNENGIEQISKYSNLLKRKGILVLVIENEYEENFYNNAKEAIANRSDLSQIKVEKFYKHEMPANTTSKENRPCVKKSSTNICHAINTGSYANTNDFKPYNSMTECTNHGGKRAENASVNLMRKRLEEAGCSY